jgi:hypothetical protein
MADVKLPGVGPVSKKWLIIVLGGSAVTIGYIVIRKRKSSAATAGASTAGTTGQVDPQTGDVAGSAQDQADLASLQAGGGYGLGTDGTGLGSGGFGNYGGYLAASPAAAAIPGAGGFTTNGEWAQQAENDLGGLGIDQVTLSAALGAYLTGRSLTADQQSLADQAIAAEGYPPASGPGGYPPAMKTGGGTTPPPPPPPPSKVTVPRVVGDRVANANSALQAAGLRSSFGARKPDVPYWVAAQSPVAGTKVAHGSTVHLTITTKRP